MSDKVREIPYYIQENAEIWDLSERRRWDIQFKGVRENNPKFMLYKAERNFGADTCAVGTDHECPFVNQVPRFEFENKDNSNWAWNQWGILNDDGYINHIIVVDKGNPYYRIGYDHFYFHKLLKDEGIVDDYFMMGAMLCRPKDGKSGVEMGIINCWKNTVNVIHSITNTAMNMGDHPRVLLTGETVFRLFFPDYQDISLRDACTMQFEHPLFRGVKFHVIPALSNWEYGSSDNVSLIVNGVKRFFDSTDDFKFKGSEHYKIINTVDEFNSMFEELIKAPKMSFDIETSGFKFCPMRVLDKDKNTVDYHMDSIIGMSFSIKESTGYYIPLDVKLKVLEEYLLGEVLTSDEVEEFLKRFSEKETAIEDKDAFLFFFGEDQRKYILHKLKMLLEEPNIFKIAQNGKFDTRFLESALGIKVANYGWDTQYSRHITNENMGKSLEIQSSEFPDLWGYKNEVKKRLKLDDYEDENYADIPLQILGIYGCGDADLTFRLMDLHLKWMEEEEKAFNGKEFIGSKTVYYKDKQGNTQKKKILSKVVANVQNKWLMTEFYMPLVELYRECELIGIKFDEQYALDLTNEYSEIINDNKEWLINILMDNTSLSPKELKEFIGNKKDGLINLSSSKQLQKMLFHPNCLGFEPIKPTNSMIANNTYKKRDKPKWYHAATDKETLKTLRENAEFTGDPIRIEVTERLLEYKHKEKMISTYLRGQKLLNVLDQNDYLHYTMRLDGTVAGRLSCIDKSTEILTNEGYKTIEDIYNNWTRQYQDSLKVLTHNNEYQLINDVFTKGVEEMFEVTCTNGKSIICTETHKFLTPKGWKTLKDIQNQKLEIIYYGD